MIATYQANAPEAVTDTFVLKYLKKPTLIYVTQARSWSVNALA